MTTKQNFVSVILIISFLITNTTNAQENKEDINNDERPQKGLYIGTDGGVSFMNLDGTYFSVAPFPEGSQSIDRNYTKYIQNFFLGYGFYTPKVYLGLEAGVSFYISEIEDRFDEPDYGFEITNSYKMELNGLVGLPLGEKSLLFGQLGLVYTDINVAANLQPFNPETSGAVHDWIGTVFGLGYSRAINEHISARAKYNVTSYFLGPKYDNEKGDGERTDYRLIDQRLSVGIVYTF